MKGLAITSIGIEDICSLEIKELIKAKTSVKKGCVVFDIKTHEDLCLLCYKAQSVSRILLLLKDFKFKKISDLQKQISKIDFSEYADKTFRVISEVIENKMSSQEINSEVGAVIECFKKVDLSNPDVIVYVYVVKDECYIGIDFSGFDLHKRSYKIFTHRTSLRGTIAYALIRLAGFGKKDVLVDPFCGSGEIPIEAALYASNFPVNYFNKEKFSFLKFCCDKFFEKIDKGINSDKLKVTGCDSEWLYLNNTKKNAKIAGINKLLSLSRLEVEWLDTKFDKGSADKIVTQPPSLSSKINPKNIEKIYNELFYQAEFILNKKGKIVLISKKTEELKKFAEKHRFKLKEEREVYSGKSVLKILVFTRNI